MISKFHPMNTRKVKYEDKKTLIYNKDLEYLLDNDPEKIKLDKGITRRRIINPVYKKLVPLFADNKIRVERRAEIPKDRPIIFVPTHGFRDDIPAVINTIDRHAYLVYASLPHFFYSLEARGIHLNGCLLIDRNDKDSKQSLIPKVIKAFNLGLDVILYAEGVWNKTPNLLVQDLYPGFYYIAQETNALIVPMALYEANGVCHVIIDEPMDVTDLSLKESKIILRDRMSTSVDELMQKYAPRVKRSDLGSFEEEYEAYLTNKIKGAKGLYDKKIENSSQFIDKSIVSAEEVFKPIESVQVNQDNAKALCYRKR